MSVRRLAFEPLLVLTVIIIINLISLAILFPTGAGAEESDEPPFPDVSLSTSGSLLELAQAIEPEPLPPQPPTPLEPERPKPEKPAEALLLEAGAILLPQGILQVEPSIEYSHWSTNDIAISGFTVFEAIVIGTIRVDELNRDIVTGALTLRYGILDRLQADVRVPVLWRQDQEVLGVGTTNEAERTTDNFNIGDLEASLSYQALNERGWIPAVITRVRARFPTGENPFEISTVDVQGNLRLSKPPTGSGFYGVGPGVTLVWTSDPVVFYVGGTYLFNLERNFAGFGDINPGNSFEWLAGINLALSERVALNVTFIDQINWSTDQNGVEVAGTSFNDGRVVLGASISLSPNTTLLVGAGIGLTDDSPDFTFTVSLPITFKLF
ncbi:MAG TPA: transporter [Candidatus Methylomirabilis sp.]|nr:transporter [Candidatus Methylomirabilis sp.]